MIMRPPTRPSIITLSPLSVHRCVESDSERASDLTHEASSHAAPCHATCCCHSRTSGSDGRRVADERPNKLRVQRQRLQRRRPRPPHHPAWPPRARSIAAVAAIVTAVAVVAAAKEPRRPAAGGGAAAVAVAAARVAACVAVLASAAVASDVRLVAARRVFGPSFAAASDSAWCGRRSLIVRVRTGSLSASQNPNPNKANANECQYQCNRTTSNKEQTKLHSIFYI